MQIRFNPIRLARIVLFLVSMSIYILAGCTKSRGTNTETMIATTPRDEVAVETIAGPTKVSDLQNTPEAEQTTIPSETPLVSDQETDAMYFGQQMFLIKSFEHDLYLVDVETGLRRIVQHGTNRGPTLFLNWTNDGCSMTVGTIDGKIVRIDLQGSSIEVIFDLADLGLSSSPTQLFLSPDDSHLAYLVGYGNLLFDGYEFQDLFILNLDDTNTSLQLTHGGRTSIVEWSPDGQHLAFEAMDQNDVKQVYIFENGETEAQQLTGNTDRDTKIKALAWSRDAEHLGISSSRGTAQVTEIYALKQESGTILFPLSAESLWWHGTGVMGVHGVLKDGGQSESGVFWIDIEAGEIIQSLQSENVPHGGVIIFPKMVSADQLGFFSGENEFIIFNLYSETFTEPLEFLGELLLSNWFPGPVNFPGEAECDGG